MFYFQIMIMVHFTLENINESGFVLHFISICKAIRTDVVQPFFTIIKVKNVFTKPEKEMPAKSTVLYHDSQS